jgi:UDP-glucose:(glucosyl)LPS alpha-1,2-glucosyltransferase
MGFAYDLLNAKSNGGTELMMRGLESRLSPEVLDNVVISRSISALSKEPESKVRIYWTHEVPATKNGPGEEYQIYMNSRWKVCDGTAFVSNWQMNEYLGRYKMVWPDWERVRVLHNAIDPIPEHDKPQDKLRLIYISNPNRGLDILYEVFVELDQKYPNLELEVYSSAKLYGLDHEDIPWRKLFKQLEEHPHIRYQKAVPNEEIRMALQRSHILAYPCVWGETSCISLIESMSAGLLCVHPNSAGLFETASNWTNMYRYRRGREEHKQAFKEALDASIQQYLDGKIDHLKDQKRSADWAYSWERRIPQWERFIQELKEGKK